MVNKYLLIVLGILIIFIIGLFAIGYFTSKEALREKILSEIYPPLTSYMKENVKKHLENIDCVPKNYEVKESELCFNCNNYDACFGYGLVIREKGQKKMNPAGIDYLTKDTFDLDLVNFYQDGLATVFNCQKENEKFLSCDFSVKFAKEDSEYKEKIRQMRQLAIGLVGSDIWIVLENETNWNKVKNLICKKLKGEESICEDFQNKITKEFDIKSCECNGAIISLKETIISYGY